MSGARDAVLGSIRAALNRRGPVPASIASSLAGRMSAPECHLRPEYSEDPVARFIYKLRAVSGIVTEVEDLAAVAPVVEAHVEKWALPFELVVAPDPELDAIPWSNRFSVERRAAVGSDSVGVTGAFAGIGESGTCVLMSDAKSPTTLNFLPEDHLVVLRRSQIVRYQEDVWRLLREQMPTLPRTVNLITGPSKTGDVEQIIQEGAHGPRRFHVVLVNA